MIELKKIIPKIFKHYFRFYTSRLLKIPYNKHGVPNEILQWLSIKNEIIVIDIGASEGNFFLRLDKTYRIKYALLIEPLPNRITELKEKYGSRFEIINCAISDKIGKSEFFISTEFDYVSSLFELSTQEKENMRIAEPQKVDINTKTLDKVVAGAKLNEIDLIKIDVQGAEHLVLKSGKNALKKTKLIYIEVSYKQLYADSSTFFDIYTILYDNNFRLVNSDEGYKSSNGELLQSDLLFINNEYF